MSGDTSHGLDDQVRRRGTSNRGSIERPEVAAPERFVQAVLEAEVVAVDGRALDFRSVIELYDRDRVGIDPADPRARMTETGSLLSARLGTAVLRSPPMRAGRAEASVVDDWARREAVLLGRRLPIEGRVRTLGRPRVVDLSGVDIDPTSGREVGGSSAAEGTALLPYDTIAAGWTGPGWRAEAVVVAPRLVVIGLVDGASLYVAVPLCCVPEIVALLHQADLARLRSTATPVAILSHQWRADRPTQSPRLGPKQGFLRRRLS